MVVAPGFIDMLGQSELTILVNPHLPSKIFQGITTEITGEGGSVAPLNDAMIAADRASYDHYHITAGLEDVPASTSRGSRKQGMGINLASYVGATQVRRMVLGDDDRAPNAGELERMKGAGAGGHAGWRGGSLHGAAICAGALCEHRRTDRAGGGSGASWAEFMPRTCAVRAMRSRPRSMK